jgi:hypothetical protein
MSQVKTAENPPSRTERETERKRQHRLSLANHLRDSVTLRNLAHTPRDRDGQRRIRELLDDIYDLTPDLIEWCESTK